MSHVPESDAVYCRVATTVVCAQQGLTCSYVRLQYLCCELVCLQQRGLLRQLQVFDVAHISWRMRVACELEQRIASLGQVSSLAVVLLTGWFAQSWVVVPQPRCIYAVLLLSSSY